MFFPSEDLFASGIVTSSVISSPLIAVPILVRTFSFDYLFRVAGLGFMIPQYSARKDILMFSSAWSASGADGTVCFLHFMLFSSLFSWEAGLRV